MPHKMKPARHLGVVGLAGIALAALPWASARAQVSPVATAPVQVSGNPDPARAHVVPWIARNPKNGTLVIADTENRTKKTVDVYVSIDDGRSWRPAGDPMVKPWTDSSSDAEANVNHTLVYDKNGVLYLAFQANDPKLTNTTSRPDRPRHIFLARSTDDGSTFQTVKVFEAPESPDVPRSAGKRNNRPWVAVDPNDPQYVYVSWMQWHTNDEPVASGNKALIASSSDGGRTFGKPFSLREGDVQGSYEARPAVDRHGTVHTVMAGRAYVPPEVPTGTPPPIRTVNYRFSTDHGQTWSEPKMIEEGNSSFSFNRKWGLRADPNSDTLYAIWYGHPNPRAALPQDDRDVYLRVSEDAGKTWSDRILVNT
ncbi:MAG: sialidase family protein, partial [Acidimicrobiales bacterium]